MSEIFWLLLIIIFICFIAAGAYAYFKFIRPMTVKTGGGGDIEIKGCNCKVSGGYASESDDDDYEVDGGYGEIEGGSGIPFRGEKGKDAPKKLIRFNNRYIDKLVPGSKVTMIACLPGKTGTGASDRKHEYTVNKIHRYDSLIKAITAHKTELGHPEKSTASDIYDKHFKEFYGTLKDGDKFAYIELK
jgi:hypothetical protein